MGLSEHTATDINLNLNLRVDGEGHADTQPAATPRHDAGGSWLRGVFVPLVTPFTPDAEHVDLTALTRLAHEVVDDGAAGIVALGTTAEVAALTPDERRTVTAACARVCAERGVPLIVGIGTNDTRAAALELAALPHPRGPVAAALVPVPYFTRPSEDGVVAHFAHLARHSPVPLIVYNIPYRTGRPLSADTLRRLARLPRVIGVKHAVGGIDKDTVELLATCADSDHGSNVDSGFAVLAGDDVFCAPLLALGAAGGILASAHIATTAFADLAAAWQHGETTRARALGHTLTPLSAALFAEPNPVVIKAVLAARSRIPSPAVRLPLLPASPATVDAALTALTRTEASIQHTTPR